MTLAEKKRRGGGARGAVGLLTVLGASSPPSTASVPWFPVVGAGLGAVLGALWWGFDEILPKFVAAGVVVAADLALTGMLHLDGWVDAADGLLPHLERERRLSVMSEPTVGAFGTTAAVILLVLRVTALGSARPPSLAGAVLLLTALWATSRAIMAFATLHLTYARQAGIVSGYGARGAAPPHRAKLSSTAVCLLVLALSALALVEWRTEAAPAVLAASLVSGAAVLALAQARLGGYTGDVLGAAGVAAETVGLVVAAAKW